MDIDSIAALLYRQKGQDKEAELVLKHHASLLKKPSKKERKFLWKLSKARLYEDMPQL